METTKTPILAVSDFIALANQTLEYALSEVAVEGEVASFKINQGKYVFFDLKDASGSVGCFMTVWQLRQPIEDGMKVVAVVSPKLTDWGKFSLTVRSIRPSGEGSLKRSFNLLKAKLDKEGLFAMERKRPLPIMPKHIALISSTQAAGYADFIKIITDRWGGMTIDVAHVQVQGKSAPNQIIRALRFFNSSESLPEVVAIVRGGGSSDDLSAFNDELLVREIAASRIPTVVGVGHETDTSMADLAADVRAATPSNAAQLIAPDKHVIVRQMRAKVSGIMPILTGEIESHREAAALRRRTAAELVQRKHSDLCVSVGQKQRLLAELNPEKVLRRGYAVVRGEVAVGQKLNIETIRQHIIAEVKHVESK